MVWAWSGAAINELRQSHTAITKALILRAGKPVAFMVAVDGSVSADSSRSVMRNTSATIVDPYGQLSGSDADDLLNPYNCEVVLYRGVQWGSPSSPNTAYAPLGVFQLTGRTVTGQGEVAITGQDRSITYQGSMTAALAISAGTPVESAIQQLLVCRNRGLQFKTYRTGFTCGPLVYAPDIDVWKEAQQLAQSVGLRLFHDRVGLCTLAPPLPSVLRSVRRFADGDGLTLTVSRAEDSDSIRNVVVVEQETGSSIRAVVYDNDPRSPTYAYGKYGYRVVTIDNPHVTSVTQAQIAARNELVNQLGRSETVTVTAVPDPTIDPTDAVTVDRALADLTNRTVIVQAVELPLSVTEAMTIRCRKYLLTEDGAQLDTGLELTTS